MKKRHQVDWRKPKLNYRIAGQPFLGLNNLVVWKLCLVLLGYCVLNRATSTNIAKTRRSFCQLTRTIKIWKAWWFGSKIQNLAAVNLPNVTIHWAVKQWSSYYNYNIHFSTTLFRRAWRPKTSFISKMVYSDKTIYFLSENNFNVSGLELEAVVQQLDPEISLVSKLLWYSYISTLYQKIAQLQVQFLCH